MHQKYWIKMIIIVEAKIICNCHIWWNYQPKPKLLTKCLKCNEDNQGSDFNLEPSSFLETRSDHTSEYTLEPIMTKYMLFPSPSGSTYTW
jgi:hypothetical protein